MWGSATGAAAAAVLAFALGAGPVLAQPGPQERARGQQRERTAVVENRGGQTLRELYVAPAGAAEPGPDRLGADTLPDGATLRVRVGRTAECRFDVRAVYQDDSTEERRGVDLCQQRRVVLGDPAAPLREVTVRNGSDITLRELYLARPGAAGRGPDRLGSRTLDPGGEFRARLGRTRDCVFDATGVFEDGSEEDRRGVNVCGAGAVLAFGDPDAPRREATVSNRADRTIREFYASTDGAARWGADRLGSEVLPQGREFRLRLRGADCVYDLRAVYEDDQAEERRRVDLCADPAVAFDGSGAPRAPERLLTLVNRHGATIREAYLSPSGDDEWGPDRLGDGMLGRGERRAVSMRGECRADLRVVFENDAAEERRALDICEATLVVIRPGWTVAERLDEGEAAGGAAGRAGGIRLRNAAASPVAALYADAPGAAARGPDRLGGALGPGEARDLAPPEPGRCEADVTAVFGDGRELRIPGLDLCSGREIRLE